MEINTLLGVLHDLGFAVYVGGLFFMEVVVAPATAEIPPAQATVLSRRAGDRHMIVAWSALAVILITGLLRLDRLHMLEFPGTFFLRPEVASNGYGRTLLAMFAAWLVLALAGLVMTFVLRPALVGKIDPRLPAEEQRARQERMVGAARWMGIVMRIDLTVAAVAVLLGASLGYGGLL